jgi:tRNA (guanine-N7-)-methyltransferase
LSDREDESTGRPGAPRFFGRRHGKKLRTSQRQTLDEGLPRLRIAAPERIFDPRSLFDFPVEQVWLEIGFGGGEHLAAQAAANPQVGLIGSEVFVNGIASLLRHVASRAVGNVRLWPDDVRQLLPFVAEASVARVFLLFPDPWPKQRHAERRFVGAANLDALARVMMDGAELRVASDDANYIAWSLEQLRAHPDFAERQDPPGVSDQPPDDWFATRYEQKARKVGRPCQYLRFWRTARSKAKSA